MTPLSRFTFFHSELDPAGVVVRNPIGWDTVVLSLERDLKFHSLIEYFKGNFLWYDDAMEIIKGISNLNEDIVVTIDLSYKAGVYINIFTGQIKLFQQEEIMIADRVNYKMTVPIIRDSFWTKFVNRLESPVDLQATVDLDGNARTAVNKIVLPMPSQKINTSLVGSVLNTVEVPAVGIGTSPGKWLQVDNTVETRSEIQTKYSLFIDANPTEPVNLISILYDGVYEFDFRFECSDLDSLGSVNVISTAFEFYYRLNSEAIVAFTKTDIINSGDSTDPDFTEFVYNTGSLNLKAGDQIRVYGRYEGGAGDYFNVIVWGTDGQAFVSSMGSLAYPTGAQGSWITGEGETIYEETSTDAYLIKDAAESIVSKIVGQNAAVKSDYLDTCKGFNAICRGKHMRGYSFSEKAFSMSFDEWWKGADPLLFLGLGYTEVGGVKKIEIEDRATFFGTTPSVNISNVNKVVRRYDLERIYKTIEFGYKKALSESDSGIDDTQTKRIWNTDFASVGVNEKVVCEWMAASLAIERSRRNRVELGKDDRNDEEIMVIALVEDGADWLPEFGTVFNAITNLLNPDFRINIRHSATRLFKRAQAWFNGCMLFSTTGEFTFNRGEGNYEMTSQFETTDCEATDDPEPVLYEGANITADTTNILFVPKIYEVESAPMSFETYQNIIADKNNAIGISRTSTGHVPMHILDLGFAVFESRANLLLLQATQNGL